MAITTKDTPYLLIVDADPTVSGAASPIGATARSSVNGYLYQKIGPLNTDWIDITLNGGIGEYIRATKTKAPSGRRDFAGSNSAALSTQALATGIIAAWPMWPWGGSYVSIGFENTAATAGNSKIGIYDEDANGFPLNRIFDSGNIATTAAGIKAAVGVPTLSRKRYWVALTQSVSTTYRGHQWDPSTIEALSYAATGVNVPRYITAPYTYGASLPATFPTPISYVEGGAGIAKPASWLIF